MTNEAERHLVRHFLAALAYRTQKAVRGAPAAFADFSASPGVRTPTELVRHMTGVIGYARTFFVGGIFRPEPLQNLHEEIERFHGTIADLAQILAAGTPIRGITFEQLLQGPLSDAMTHAGQLAMLRRMSGSPIESENFIFAKITPDQLSISQPLPAAPTPRWMGSVVHVMWKITRWRQERR